MSSVLIANESQWRTEDLTEIVRRIEETPGFSRENFYRDTLLLFQTSRKKEKKKKHAWQDDTKPPAAEHLRHGKLADRYEDTRLVLIRSTDAIGADVLDRLANSDVQQDMSGEDVLKVIREIARAIGGYRGEDCDFSWSTEVALRIGGTGKRTAESVEREIRGVRNEQNRIRRQAREWNEKLDKKIEALEAKKAKRSS